MRDGVADQLLRRPEQLGVAVAAVGAGVPIDVEPEHDCRRRARRPAARAAPSAASRPTCSSTRGCSSPITPRISAAISVRASADGLQRRVVLGGLLDGVAHGEHALQHAVVQVAGQPRPCPLVGVQRLLDEALARLQEVGQPPLAARQQRRQADEHGADPGRGRAPARTPASTAPLRDELGCASAWTR